ncbi:hypothetical protein Syun_006517 [Stephania yunnanensis]|uniref:Uncharacterized protein n=1 Tax=Stephania yunnanensis TaxID=152371 RepID=A0AAP0KWV3_9MAGN
MYGSILLCSGNATECFYSTLNLKCLGRFDNRHNNFYQVRVKGQELLQMGHKAAESPAHVGNKVLPICEASVTSSTSTDDQCVSSEKKEKQKCGDKNKTISRMKELLRWTAASQGEKGGSTSRSAESCGARTMTEEGLKGDGPDRLRLATNSTMSL